MNLIPIKHLLAVILMSTMLLIGCAPTKSIISLSNNFNLTSSQTAERSPHRVGLVMDMTLASEVARSTASSGLLVYDFEFKVGQDILETLPKYLDSFMNVIILDLFEERNDLDSILVPKITSSLVVTIRPSAAPSYDLSIGLDLTVIKDGKIQHIILSRKNSHVDIPASENSDKLRDIKMKSEYQNQLTSVYSDLEAQLIKLGIR